MATHGAIVSGPDAQVWRPLGQVLGAPLAVDWAASHASYPTAVPLGGDRVRVYFFAARCRRTVLLGQH